MAASGAVETPSGESGLCQPARRSAFFGAKKAILAATPKPKRLGAGRLREQGGPLPLVNRHTSPTLRKQPLALIPLHLRAKLREPESEVPVFSTRDVLELVETIRQQIADDVSLEFSRILERKVAAAEQKGEKLIEELSLPRTEIPSYIS